MPRHAVTIAMVAFALVILATLLTGCESDTTVAPDPIGGWVEGYIIDGGEGELGGREIRVTHRPWGGEWMEVDLETDADGYYCIGLPDGEALITTSGYRTMHYTHNGPTYDADEADTLRVDGGVTRADFLCGRLHVVSDADPALGGRWGEASIVIPPLEGGGGWGFIYSLVGSSYSDVDGVVVSRFRFVLPGDYMIRHRPEGWSHGYYIPGSYRPDEAAFHTVTGGEVATVVIDSPAPAVLRGRIEGSWEEFGFVPDFRLRVAGGFTLQWVTCDAEGRFEVAIPAGGDFELQFDMEDTTGTHSSPYHWVGGDTATEAMVYSVDSGEFSEEIVVQVGGVEVELSGDPDLTRTWVTIYDDTDEPLANPHTYHDSSECIRIGNLLPGFYKLRIASNGISVPCFHDGALRLDTAQLLEIRAGEVSHLDLQLTPGGSIVGQMIQPDGSLFVDCFELAVHSIDDRYVAFREMDRCGWDTELQFEFDETTCEFRVRGLARGQYKLRILTYDLDEWLWYPGVTSWDDATPVTVPEGGDAAWFQWIVSPPAP